MAKSQVSPALPGVSRIFFIPCPELPEMLMVSAICSSALALPRSSLTDIPFSGNPTFRREGTLMGSARAEKCTLEFRSDCRLPISVYLAFVVEFVDRSAVIIGTRERNFPVIAFDDSGGAPGGDPKIRTWKISHTDIKSGLPVII